MGCRSPRLLLKIICQLFYEMKNELKEDEGEIAQGEW